MFKTHNVSKHSHIMSIETMRDGIKLRNLFNIHVSFIFVSFDLQMSNIGILLFICHIHEPIDKEFIYHGQWKLFLGSFFFICYFLLSLRSNMD